LNAPCTNKSAIPVLFADDTSILIADPNLNDFRSKLFSVFNTISEWLMVNSLSLNLNKTYYMQFKGTSKPLTIITTIHVDIQITTVSEVKLSTACYKIRSNISYVSFKILNMVYYSYFQS
jgi:hypothetical protein